MYLYIVPICIFFYLLVNQALERWSIVIFSYLVNVNKYAHIVKYAKVTVQQAHKKYITHTISEN